MKPELNYFATEHGVPVLLFERLEDGGGKIVVAKRNFPVHSFRFDAAQLQKLRDAIATADEAFLWPEPEPMPAVNDFERILASDPQLAAEWRNVVNSGDHSRIKTFLRERCGREWVSGVGIETADPQTAPDAQ